MPSGQWWDYAVKHIPNLLLVYRETPTKIFNQGIEFPEHRSDVTRVEAIVMLGVYERTWFQNLVFENFFSSTVVHIATTGRRKIDLLSKLCNSLQTGTRWLVEKHHHPLLKLGFREDLKLENHPTPSPPPLKLGFRVVYAQE